MPILPLTDEVLSMLNNSVGSMALIACIKAVQEEGAAVNATHEGACGPVN